MMSELVEKILEDVTRSVKVVLDRHIGKLESETKKQVLKDIQTSLGIQPSGSSKPAANGSARSGWLKGVPRSPKTPDEQKLADDYKRAREAGYNPADLPDLAKWVTENPAPAPKPKKAAKPDQVQKAAEALPVG